MQGDGLNGEEGLECKVWIHGLKHVSEFKHFGYVLNESGIDEAEHHRKVAVGRRVADAISSLVNSRVLQLEWAKVLHETLLVPVLIYGSETII